MVFYGWAVAVEGDEVTRLAATIDTRQDEVLAFFDTGASNASTEGCNVRIMSIRRAVRGLKKGNYQARMPLHARLATWASDPPRGSAPTRSPNAD